jgi:hypothetical protein
MKANGNKMAAEEQAETRLGQLLEQIKRKDE